MSERMSEREWEGLKGDYWDENDQNRVVRELNRARASEDIKDAEIARLNEASSAQRTAMVRAVAELRHTYGNHAQGHKLDPELISRAIRLLEEALAPAKDSAP